MYSVYKQIHPPTAIEHCLYCKLFSSDEECLVVSSGSWLYVYRLYEYLDKKKLTTGDANQSGKPQLECVLSRQLLSNIMCMQAARLSSAKRDSLLLCFKEAKLSLVEYDPTSHDLVTSSIHYFEGPNVKGQFTFAHNVFAPIVRVDPDDRCAVMLAFGRRLIVIPLRIDTKMSDTKSLETDESEGKAAQLLTSYVIDSEPIVNKITNIIDFQFLYGYYEPTLFIIYEPQRTWSGRLAVSRDTCCIAAISINMSQKLNPIIWEIESLPYNCLQAVPVPKPIGGVLVVTSDALIFLNQATAPVSVSVNSFAEKTTLFPMKRQAGVTLALDNAKFAFINYNQMIVSLRGGELYTITLVVDAVRTLRCFHFEKSASSVLTSCMCYIEEDYLFLGSRLGNSLLLRFKHKSDVRLDAGFMVPSLSVPSGRSTSDYDFDDVYGSSLQTQDTSSTLVPSYSFEICDHLLNIAPCSHLTMGEPSFLSEEFSSTSDPSSGKPTDPDIELVTTSGYGKNGAFTVLQRTVRPQVVTTFELPGCYDMWTVLNRSPTADIATIQYDAFLILNRADSTMILQTGQEISELDQSGFMTSTCTLYAGNIGFNNSHIIQVLPLCIVLLEGVNQIQKIDFDGSPFVDCTTCGPFALLMKESGQVTLYTIGQQLSTDKEDDSPTIQLMEVGNAESFGQNTKFSAIALYRDLSGIFLKGAYEQNTESNHDLEASPSDVVREPETKRIKTEAEEEEEMLYGDLSPKENEPVVPTSLPIKRSKTVKEYDPTYWAFFITRVGSLEIYSLPDLELSYRVNLFSTAPKLAIDCGLTQPSHDSSSLNTSMSSDLTTGSCADIKELIVVGFGLNGTRPLLLARTQDDLLIYEAFRFDQVAAHNHLKTRFKRIMHDVIIRDRSSVTARREERDITNIPRYASKLIRPFSDIAGYSGVFVCGAYPYWLFMTGRGVLRTHPMVIDGDVVCFSPFHNVNCSRGFLYFNTQGELRISLLPTHLTYDAPWPMRKVALRKTVHYIEYHFVSKTYAVVTSTEHPSNTVMKVESEGEKQLIELERDDGFVSPTLSSYSLQLYSPLTWEPIPNTEVKLKEFEMVLAAKVIRLKRPGNSDGSHFICLGTNFALGEDTLSKGRILLYDAVTVIPEPGQPLTKNRLKMVLEKEERGPVTAVCGCIGYLLTSVGQRVYLWTMRDNELVGQAFVDMQIYVHQMVSVKNLVLVADLQKSISLLRYQENMRVLSIVSRDANPLDTYGIQFCVNGSQLSFIVSDQDQNILMFMYIPEENSWRLLRRADFNTGSHVMCMVRARCRLAEFQENKRELTLVEKRHTTFLVGLDGSISYLLPVHEKVYRRLLSLHMLLSNQTHHLGGLNPKETRAIKSRHKTLQNPMKNIIDGDLIWSYLGLPVKDRIELAKRLGTSVEQVLDTITEIDRQSTIF